MASVIQIKRSANVTAPTTSDITEGELAYSEDKSNNGAGARLYIGSLNSGGSAVVDTIGGKYYTAKVDASTSTNTNNTIVQRDTSGNFSAGTITATLSGSATSANIASFANVLTTARDIGLAGDLTGNVSFNGSQDVTLTATIAANSVALGTDTTGNYIANVIPGTGLTGSGFGTEGATPTLTLATSGVSASTYGGTSQIPVITVDTYGRITSAANTAISVASNAFTTVSVSGQSDVVADNASDTITFANTLGIVIGTNATTDTVSFSLSNTGVSAATYGGTTAIPVLVVDAQGRITSASNASISTSFTVAADSGANQTISGGDTLTIVGGAGIASVASATDTVTLNLETTGVAAATYGSAAIVPVFTVDAYGRITSTSNTTIAIPSSALTTDVALGTQTSGAYVANLVAGTGITLSGLGNEGTTPTITNAGVTSLAGTTNQITASASTGSITLSLPNNVTIPGNLSVTGNLNILGNVTSVGTTDLKVDDSLIYLANNNYSSDLIDIGFLGNYYDGSSQRHAGLFRDASDSGKFKLFTNLQPEPSSSVIDTANASFSVATLVANITGGTVSGLSANINVSDGGTGRGTLTTNAVLYGLGTSAVGLATGTAGQVLQLNASGVPTFAGLDGGSY